MGDVQAFCQNGNNHRGKGCYTFLVITRLAGCPLDSMKQLTKWAAVRPAFFLCDFSRCHIIGVGEILMLVRADMASPTLHALLLAHTTLV